MHDDYRLNWTQPIGALGPLVKKQEPERVCEFREFEAKIYTAPEGDQPFDGMTAPTQHTAAPPSTGKWVPKVGDRVLCDSSSGRVGQGVVVRQCGPKSMFPGEFECQLEGWSGIFTEEQLRPL